MQPQSSAPSCVLHAMGVRQFVLILLLVFASQSSHGITLDIDKVKNSNKNPVAERVMEVLSMELLNRSPEVEPVSDVTLALVTANTNSRIRRDGLSAAFSVGDLVFLKSDKDKLKAREKYLVVNVSVDLSCKLRKFTPSQFRSKVYYAFSRNHRLHPLCICHLILLLPFLFRLCMFLFLVNYFCMYRFTAVIGYQGIEGEHSHGNHATMLVAMYPAVVIAGHARSIRVCSMSLPLVKVDIKPSSKRSGSFLLTQ